MVAYERPASAGYATPYQTWFKTTVPIHQGARHKFMEENNMENKQTNITIHG